MDNSKLYFAENIRKRWLVFLTLVAIYIPYSWLWVVGGWNWSLIQIWPLLPGIAVSALIPSLPRGPDFPLLITALLLGISLFGVIIVRKAFWPTVVGMFALSCALSWIVYLLMKA